MIDSSLLRPQDDTADRISISREILLLFPSLPFASLSLSPVLCIFFSRLKSFGFLSLKDDAQWSSSVRTGLMEIVRQLAGLSVSHIRQFRDDDSYIDRLNHRYTTTLCVVFAILVTTKQYAGRNNWFFFSKEKLIIHFFSFPAFVSPFQAIQSIAG